MYPISTIEPTNILLFRLGDWGIQILAIYITEVKQHGARLVLVWVTGARVTLPAMCRSVGQASHIMLPLSTQQWL